MFTGLISGVGEVASVEGSVFTLHVTYPAPSIEQGASIAFDGCCLTVTGLTPVDATTTRVIVDVSNETLERTTLGTWQAGRRVNTERSLKLGDELGGHMVTGHVDGTAEIKHIADDGNARLFSFAVPHALAGFLAQKGSVALDGTSLTINLVERNLISVALIPHTRAVTTWGARQVGDRVNIEVDVLARYVARQNDVARDRG